MYCKYCGEEIDADSRFCVSCGKQLISNDSEFSLDESPANAKSKPLVARHSDSVHTELLYFPDRRMKQNNIRLIVAGFVIAVIIGVINRDIPVYTGSEELRTFGLILFCFRLIFMVIFYDSIKQRNRSVIGWEIFVLFSPPLFMICLGFAGTKSFSFEGRLDKETREDLRDHIDYLVKNEHWRLAINHVSQALKRCDKALSANEKAHLLFSRATSLFHIQEYQLVKNDLEPIIDDPKYGKKAFFWLNKIQPYLES